MAAPQSSWLLGPDVVGAWDSLKWYHRPSLLCLAAKLPLVRGDVEGLRCHLL
jgi:hypothetical protein